MTTSKDVTIDYTNHKGVRDTRTILPIRVEFGLSEWHPEGEQWFLVAYDHAKNAERWFALKDIHSWTNWL